MTEDRAGVDGRPVQQAHPQCRNGHVCQEPSGRTCVEPGCLRGAGTWWGPLWCPEHDEVIRWRSATGCDTPEEADRLGESLAREAKEVVRLRAELDEARNERDQLRQLRSAIVDLLIRSESPSVVSDETEAGE